LLERADRSHRVRGLSVRPRPILLALFEDVISDIVDGINTVYQSFILMLDVQPVTPGLQL